jgi:hypothetical protein
MTNQSYVVAYHGERSKEAATHLDHRAIEIFRVGGQLGPSKEEGWRKSDSM